MGASDSAQVSRLAVHETHRDGVYTVRLVGELDADGCRKAERALRKAERSEAARIVLDIDELRFIDSAGLELLLFLLRAKRRDGARGGRLRMTRGTGHVADMLRLTNLESSLPFVPAY